MKDTTSEPRILSIKQPYVWAILAGKKKVENRSWNTEYRGIVYLHAGKAFNKGALVWMEEDMGLRVPKDLPIGAIVGTCILKNVITDDEEGKYGDWYDGEYGLILAKPRTLAKPIPLLGQLGLYRASPEIIKRVEKQLE